jgi:hypothetical protein
MERKAYWYSVVQYCPNEVRGEKINIGLMLHSPEEGALYHSMLDDNSQKIKGLLIEEVAAKTFKVQKDIFDFYLKKIYEEPSLFDPDVHKQDFLIKVQEHLPVQFSFSEPTFSLTREPNQLFESLTKTYIGEMIVSKEIITELDISRNAKQYTKNVFTQRQWLGTKIKTNVKIHPIKDLNHMNFNVDFIFKNGIWNLIQAVPSNSTPEKMTEWFSKTNTMLGSYQNDSGCYLVYDRFDQMNQDRTIEHMVEYLKKNDPRVTPAAIDSDSFSKLCMKVDSEAKDLTEYESELIAM